MKRALLYIPDLFFAARVADILKHLGFTAQDIDVRGDLAAQLQGADLMLVQLDAARATWTNVIAAARQAHVPSIAFGSHVEKENLKTAAYAGATHVITNGELVARLPRLIEHMTQNNTQ